MERIENIKEKFIGNILFPFSSYLMNRRGILKKYRSAIAAEHYPEEKLQELQLLKLKRLVQYANKWVPFYTKQFKEMNFSPEDLNVLDDIKHIPPLRREDVIEFRTELVDMRYHHSMVHADNSGRPVGEPIPFARFRKHKLVKNTSSGSTGAPTIFYEDGSVTGLNWINEMRMRNWYGIKPGAREMRMARISTDFMPSDTKIRLRKMLWNQMILPGTNLSDNDYRISYTSLKEFKPRVFWGFTSALYGLAEYIEKTGADMTGIRPQLIIAWAAPLYEHERNKLEKIFKCSITNIYGAREVGHIGAYCPHGSLHINQDSHLVETDKDYDTYQSEDAGELLVTNLEITPMPFIRYRMGDVGAVSSSSCSCGRTLQVINNFLGRTGEIFVTKDGQMISPNFWCRTFMNDKVASAFSRFQVIYTRDKDIRIKLVKKVDDTTNAESALREFLKTNFNSSTNINFDFVSEIKPQISGKYQMVVNEAKQETHS